MDRKTVEKVKKEIEGIAEKNDISLERILVFGSRARDDYREDSDVDILLVSESFRQQPSARRSRELYLEWDYENLPEPEFICLTPEEFRKKKDGRGVVGRAVDEGVRV